MRSTLKLNALLCSAALTLSASCIRPKPKPPTPPPPPPPAVRTVATIVLSGGSPVVGADCHLKVSTGSIDGTTSNTGYVPWNGVLASDRAVEVDCTHPEFHDLAFPYTLKTGNNEDIPPVDMVADWPQPVARAPLTPEGDGPNGLICHHDEMMAPSDSPDINFWRTDLWGVTIPGLPFVPGGSSVHPERVLSWFFDRYMAISPDWGRKILVQNRLNGYTHFVLSIPDAVQGIGGNLTIDQYVKQSQYIKTAIPYVAHFLTSKCCDPQDAPAADRMARITPVVDALIAGNAVDILIVGWELDLFNSGQSLQDFIDALHAKYPNIPLYVHFTTYKTSWQLPGEPRAAFWDRNRGKLRGLLYQGNPNDSCGLMEAHYNDAQVPASGLAAGGFLLVPFELVGAVQFDGIGGADEQFGVTRNVEVMATPGPIRAAGFGNGGRLYNGQPSLTRYPQ